MTKPPAKNIIRYKNLGARIEERRAADFYDNTQLLPDKNVKIKTFIFWSGESTVSALQMYEKIRQRCENVQLKNASRKKIVRNGCINKKKTSNICRQHSNMHISARIMAEYYSSYSKYAKTA